MLVEVKPTPFMPVTITLENEGELIAFAAMLDNIAQQIDGDVTKTLSSSTFDFSLMLRSAIDDVMES